MRVYFVGASGAGKTTLARRVQSRFGLPLLPSIARKLMEEWDLTGDRLSADLDMANAFQRKVFERQLEAERNAGPNFVSDRCFDHIAYAAERSLIAWQVVRHPDWFAYLDALRSDDVLLFFVRPHQGPLPDDLQRRPFLSQSEVHRVDGALQLILESNNLPYFPVAGFTLKDRARLVDAVLERIKRLIG